MLVKLLLGVIVVSMPIVASTAAQFLIPGITLQVGSSSDPAVGILPSYNDAWLNWKNAGMQAASPAGIPNRSTQCGSTISPSGLTPPTAGDDAALINAAIAACPAGNVIQLASGQFSFDVSETILINKGVTLRGTGNCTGSTKYALCATQLVRTNGLLKYDQSACGTSTSSTNACDSLPFIFMSNGALFTTDWGGCDDGVMADCHGSNSTLTSDAAQGDATIHVTTTGIFSVGQWVLINEATAAAFQTDPVPRAAYGGNPGQVWAAPDTFNTTGGPATGRTAYLYFNPYPGYGATTAANAQGESFNYSGFVDRPYGEMHLIKAIGTGTITFDDPIMVGFRQSGGHDARVIPAGMAGSASVAPMLQGASVENLTIGRGDQSNITLRFCVYCWVKNVESYGWTGGAVEIQASARVEITNVDGYECWNSVNNGTEYAFDFELGSTEVMMDNSISRLSGKNMTNRGGGAGSVVAYNYLDDPWYDRDSGIGNYWTDLSANASHFPGSHHVLFEGNWTVNMEADDTHGSGADYMTFYRNNSTGFRSPFTDPETGAAANDFTGAGLFSCNGSPVVCTATGAQGNARAAGPMAYNYWYAFVGNYMGSPGNAIAANGWNFNRIFAAGAKTIWESGTVGGEGVGDPNLTNFSGGTQFMFRDGNFDTVTGTTTWSASPHTLPSSMFLTAAPAYFATVASCAYGWPWINPIAPSIGMATGPGSCSTYSGLPAKARFDAGTPLAQP